MVLSILGFFDFWVNLVCTEVWKFGNLGEFRGLGVSGFRGKWGFWGFEGFFDFFGVF